MSQYVAAYDVHEDRQRSKIADLLSQYGHRIQKSVFIIDLEPDDFPKLRFDIGRHLTSSDEFDIIPIDDSADRPCLR